MFRLLSLGLITFSWLTCSLASAKDYPLLVEEDFEQGADRWITSDPAGAAPVWSVVADPSNGANRILRVAGPGAYKPPHRSPFAKALLKDVVVADFELTCRLQNTNAKAGAHRDLCLFWGYQGPGHFYYVHLGAKPDPHSCQIFIVNGSDRTKITVDGSSGTPWTDDWHTARVVRRVADGTMEVYFDDMDTPALTAKDTTFTWGQVGIGTFDDHGNFDDITLRGIEVEKPAHSDVELTVEPSEAGAAVKVDGQLMAEYVTRSGHQPIVWPLVGPRGDSLTRQYPMAELGDAEVNDHPHHRSLWFNHGQVNRLDFWAEPRRGRPNNQIVHREFAKLEASGAQATIVTINDWTSNDKKICEDQRTLKFFVDEQGNRGIDYTIVIRATERDVTFGDTKEGSFAVRVAGSMKVTAKQGGKIINSHGQTDGKAWGMPAEWVNYTGPVAGKPGGIAMFSHPDSFRHPQGWHVRTYGLFAANPFAEKDFPENGIDQGEVTLSKGDELKLRYLVYLHDGTISADELNEVAAKYAGVAKPVSIAEQADE